MHRIEKVQETEVYITIRNHKKSFLNKTSWYFINPSKHIVRWLSKVILNKMNNDIQKETCANQ